MTCKINWISESRSKSQQRFKMSLNVCSDDIFWIVTYFVTKLGMVVQHHKPECHAEKKCLLSTRSRSQRGLICSKYYSFYYIFCIADSLATKRGLMVHHQKLECLGKKLITVFKVKVTGKVQNVNECLSRWYLLNRHTFFYQTCYGEAL